MRVPVRLLFGFVCLWFFATDGQAQERVAGSFAFQMNTRNRPIVHVQMNTVYGFNFEIDTGAGVSLMTEATATRLGLTPQLAFDEQQKPVLLEGKQARAVVVPNFPLGAMRFDMPFLVVSSDKLMNPNGIPSDGLIGANLLQNYAALFDFTQHRLTLYEGGKLTPQELEKAGMKDAIIVPQEGGDEGVFQVKGQVTNKDKQIEGTFLIDTGADCTLISAELAKQLQLKPTKLPTTNYTFLGKVKMNTSHVDRIAFGSLILTEEDILYPDKPLANYTLQIGMNVLVRYRLLLDFPQHKAYFQRDEHANSVPHSNAVGNSP